MMMNLVVAGFIFLAITPLSILSSLNRKWIFGQAGEKADLRKIKFSGKTF